MKKRILAAVLTVILALSVFTGCSGNKYIMTAGGKKMDAGFFSFYVHWQRDYYKELLKTYGYDIDTSLDSYYTETETVRQYIVSQAKTQYLSYIVISAKFDELGLTLDEETKTEINRMYDEEWTGVYGEAGMKTILKTLGLTKDEFKSILSVQSKSDAIIEYYYGENGQKPITEQEKKDYYSTNYLRFKYVFLSKQNSESKDLPTDEIAQKRVLSDEIYLKATTGTAFEDLIAQYSEDYSKITDDMTEDEKKTIEDNQKKATTEGMICDLNGIYNEALYTNYNITVDSAIVKRLQSMSVGETAVVEISNSIWVIQKYDTNESESYYNDRAAAIYQALYGEDFSAKYTQWLAELDYKFDDETLKAFDPGTFTDCFSDVYTDDDADTSSGS